MNEEKCFILLSMIRFLFMFVNLTKSNATMYEQYASEKSTLCIGGSDFTVNIGFVALCPCSVSLH